jgi:hypothetical protein
MKMKKAIAYLLPSAAILAGVILVAQTDADPDGDGVPNVFEIFFGLSGDAAAPEADPDSDLMDNAAEKTAWTDPLNPDTDFDGWSDSLDADPVSRAIYLWGDPRFTYGEINAYPRPPWARHGAALGGSHVEYPGYGHAWVLEPELGYLLMPVDRLAQSNDLWLAVSALADGFMAVDMLDSNLVSVAPAVGLAPAGDTWFTNRIPLSAYPEARTVSLHVTQGVAHVFASMLYVDTDGNGFDDAQDEQLSGLTGSPLANMAPAPVSGSAPSTSTNVPLSQAPFVWRLGFEQLEGYSAGPVNGVQGWTASNGVEVVAGQAAEGSQSLLMRRTLAGDERSEATRPIPSSLSSNIVWVSMRTKFVSGSGGANPTNASAVFAMEGDRIVAYDGTRRIWVYTDRSFPDITNIWARIDIRFDFDAKKYTLCCQGVAVCRDFGFADPSISGLNTIVAQNGSRGDAGMDAIVVSDREPDGLDFDADGVPNAQERSLGTDTWSDDTDNDGIKDAVEIANGWNPIVHNSDPDEDGIPTADETGRFATDPAKTDSDNDSIPDVYQVAAIGGAAFTAKSGSWTAQGDAVTASEGSLLRLAYDVTLPSPGFHQVSIALSNVTASAALHSLTLYCDDAVISTFASAIPAGGATWQVWTPWLPAGLNRFRIVWTEDAPAGRRLSVLNFRVNGIDSGASARSLWCSLNPGTADSDFDGLTDLYETGSSTTLVTRVDSDTDLLWDSDESSIFRLDPNIPDTDNDGTPDGTVASFRAGVDTSARYVTHITTDFTASGDSLVWANSTASSCAYDLTVETPGFYVLELQARNFQYDPPANYRFTFNASLLDRGIGSIYVAGDIDRAGKGRIITPWLPAGVHRFKIAWANRVVSGSRISRPALDFIRLIAVDGADADNDGIQDWMEDRLAATTADSDGDGVLDRDEVRVRGSNPLNTDTDFDGLTDKEEITAGTSLLNDDTDGDGVSDKEEIRIGTNPLTQSFGTAWTAIAVKTGSEADKTEGQFFRDASMLVAHSRGTVEYVFDLPSDAKPVLRVIGRHEWRGLSGATPVTRSDFLVYADGQLVGRYWLRDADGSFDAVLPFMKAGARRIRIVWNAVDAGLGLKIASVGLGSLGGADADANGIADWITTSSARTNFAFKAVIASPLSPACIEGSARWPELVTGAFNGSAVTVRPAIAGRWYADIALDPSGVVAPLALSFENGACTSSVAVAWTPLDLATGVTTMNARLGDTLRLGVSQEGSAVLTAVNASGTVISSAAVVQGVPLDVPLSLDGAWIFTTVWTPATGSPVTRTLTVNVYGGSLPAAVPACQLGRARSWIISGLTPGVKLEAASGLSVSLSGNTNATLNVSSAYMDHYVLLRAGTGGPILDSRRAVPFWVQSAVDSYLSVIEQLPNNSQLWEGRLVTFNVPADVGVEISIFVGGVTFDDLSLVRTFPGSSLGQAGEYVYRLIHPNSVSASSCHRIRSYQDGLPLGDAYGGGIGLPADLKQPVQ